MNHMILDNVIKRCGSLSLSQENCCNTYKTIKMVFTSYPTQSSKNLFPRRPNLPNPLTFVSPGLDPDLRKPKRLQGASDHDPRGASTPLMYLTIYGFRSL